MSNDTREFKRRTADSILQSLNAAREWMDDGKVGLPPPPPAPPNVIVSHGFCGAYEDKACRRANGMVECLWQSATKVWGNIVGGRL